MVLNSRSRFSINLTLWGVFVAMALSSSLSLAGTQTVATGPNVSYSKLDNGLEVVVIPDHRAPVVTHMIWYKVGAADETPGVSGIAHFLEHLMFKGTNKIPSGEFSKIIARNGGDDNAFTSQDVTAYYQRVAKDRLPLVMEMEADRMANLVLNEAEVLTERDVVLEERRSRIENDPSSLLDEQMQAALYLSHPYGSPVIGWQHEIAALDRDDALAHYRHYYAPNNAILVVAGDVEPDEVLDLARQTYGTIAANPKITPRVRPSEPPHLTPRRMELKDPRAGNPTFQRYYLAPSYSTSKPGDAEALDLFMKVLASGSTSRIYRALVVDQKIASSAGGWFQGSGFDYGRVVLYAIPVDGVSLDEVEAALDKVVADVLATGITEIELERAKKIYVADYIYGSDNQSGLARRYGWGMATGRSIADIEAWPERIRAVTVDGAMAAGKANLDIRRSVTGHLIPVPSKQAGQQAGSKS